MLWLPALLFNLLPAPELLVRARTGADSSLGSEEAATDPQDETLGLRPGRHRQWLRVNAKTPSTLECLATMKAQPSGRSPPGGGRSRSAAGQASAALEHFRFR